MKQKLSVINYEWRIIINGLGHKQHVNAITQKLSAEFHETLQDFRYQYVDPCRITFIVNDDRIIFFEKI